MWKTLDPDRQRLRAARSSVHTAGLRIRRAARELVHQLEFSLKVAFLWLPILVVAVARPGSGFRARP
jgi:hypothetical protein